jgi:hypothetical protein
MKNNVFVFTFLLLGLATCAHDGKAQVPTVYYSNSRLGSTSTETQLTPSNVTTGKFALRATCAVDGPVFGQPAIVSSGGKNLLIVATMNDSIYAFDLDSRPCTAVWTNLVFAGSWSTGFPQTPTLFDSGNIGCVAAPVVDVPNGFVYAVCANNSPNWVLWKFNLATGATVSNVTLAPSVPGTGDPSGGDRVVGGNVLFFPNFEICRSGLTLANGNVYVGCGSFNDLHPWHGWLVAYNASTLAQVGVFNSTPNGGGGGFWMSSGGLAADGLGNLYAVSGNGDFDGATNFSMTAVKLGSTLSLVDWFTPSNWSALSALDIDLGSGQPMLIPGTSLLVWGAKDFKAYSVNTGCMGHLGGTVGCAAPQVFLTNPSPPAGAQGGIWMNMFMNGVGYFSTSAFVGGSTSPQSVYSCALTGSSWNTTCSATTSTWQYPGGSPGGSINGTAGILWLLTVANNAHSTGQPATLRAVDPVSFTEFWNSGAIGNLSKFVQPVIANGKVVVATISGNVQVFGLIPSATIRGVSTMRGGAVIR